MQRVLPQRNQTHDAMSDARNAGYSWSDINSYIAGKKQAALDSGDDISAAQAQMGLGDPNALNQRLSQMAQMNMSQPDVQSE